MATKKVKSHSKRMNTLKQLSEEDVTNFVLRLGRSTSEAPRSRLSIRRLSLERQNISSFEPQSFRQLTSLTSLDLSRNVLTSLVGLESLPQLSLLSLYHNALADRMELINLTGLSNLRDLDVRLNPFTRTKGSSHRSFTLKTIPWLIRLDGRLVEATEVETRSDTSNGIRNSKNKNNILINSGNSSRLQSREIKNNSSFSDHRKNLEGNNLNSTQMRNSRNSPMRKLNRLHRDNDRANVLLCNKNKNFMKNRKQQSECVEKGNPSEHILKSSPKLTIQNNPPNHLMTNYIEELNLAKQSVMRLTDENRKLKEEAKIREDAFLVAAERWKTSFELLRKELSCCASTNVPTTICVEGNEAQQIEQLIGKERYHNILFQKQTSIKKSSTNSLQINSINPNALCNNKKDSVVNKVSEKENETEQTIQQQITKNVVQKKNTDRKPPMSPPHIQATAVTAWEERQPPSPRALPLYDRKTMTSFKQQEILRKIIKSGELEINEIADKTNNFSSINDILPGMELSSTQLPSVNESLDLFMKSHN